MTTQSPEWIVAARVLRRSGFGAKGADVDSAVAAGSPEIYVRDMLNADFQNDPGVLETPPPDLKVSKRPDDVTAESYERYFERKAAQNRDLAQWWLRRMVAAQMPVREKLTFLWHNHFATSATKVSSAPLMLAQNEKLRRYCLGDFRTLAFEMLIDPAMITWLDGKENMVGAVNENLAREFMELFALGHGNGYSEHDVREAARALTGWVVEKKARSAELVGKRHDDSVKTVLNTTARLRAGDLCDIVLAEPSSARYVAGRLWQHLASDQRPSEETVDRLVAAYGPSRDLRSLTNAVLTDQDFLGSPASVVTGPVEWLIGFVRTLQIDPIEVQVVVDALKRLGQLPFYPPGVGGWPQGQAWLSAPAASIRLQIAGALVEHADIDVVVDSPPKDRIDAVGYMIGVGAWSERTVKALMPVRNRPASLVVAAVNTPEYLTS
ncbi:DUF1800 domain-containing protein [Mycolicibacterium iranicum]|uniref:DUF1800 domain-containing protein n=1 Tax=Mycolicibacterium iranicum TaxID=912594 RepID=UPI000A161432|nr:DUF1800 domain-containing protein [Mycolicibacterium iranicum]